MNWAVLSLPLAASTSLLVVVAVAYLYAPLAFKDARVPSLRVEDPPADKIKDKLASIFKTAPQQDITQIGTTTAPETKVDLVGISLGAKSMALLKVSKKVIVLEEGETKRGIKLKKVYKDRVEISVNGRDTILRLKKVKTASITQPSVKNNTTSDVVVIPKKEVEKVTKDPGIMFSQIRLVPYIKNGKTEGFLFEWVKPESILHKAGIRRGDVIVSINNMDIRSGEDGFKILQVLRNEPSLKVVVLRGGKRKEINIRIE